MTVKQQLHDVILPVKFCTTNHKLLQYRRTNAKYVLLANLIQKHFMQNNFSIDSQMNCGSYLFSTWVVEITLKLFNRVE